MTDIEGKAWDVCTQWLKPGEAARTAFIAGRICGPHDDYQSIIRALVRLAESGTCPFVERGPAEQRRVYGKATMVRPWIWRKPTVARSEASRCPHCGQVMPAQGGGLVQTVTMKE